MTSPLQQPIIFKAYDPFAPKTKHKTGAGAMKTKTNSCEPNAPLVTEDRGKDEVDRPSGEPEPRQTCDQEPPSYLSRGTKRLDSHMDKHRLLDDFSSTLRGQLSIAVPNRPSDTAPYPQDNYLHIGTGSAAGSAAGSREREGLADAADPRLNVEGPVEAFLEPFLEEPNAVHSSAVRTDSFRLRKRARSRSADTNDRVVRPLSLNSRRISSRNQPSKRRKLAENLQEDAKLTSPSNSIAPSRISDSRRIFSRDRGGLGDIDYDSNESSDLQSRSDYSVKGRLAPSTPTMVYPTVHRQSTNGHSETENSANEDERVDSEVGESSRASSTLSYNSCNRILSAGPQRRHRASVDTLCPPPRSRCKKDWSTAPVRKRLNSDTFQSKAMRISKRASKGLGRQRRASPVTTSSMRSSGCYHQSSNSLFEISGLSSHFQPNSDTVVANLRALNPQSLTTATIPGLEAFGAEFQTVYRMQRTQESWLLIGFQDRTTSSISRTERTRRSPGLEQESYTSRDTTDFKQGSAEDRSEEDEDHAAGDVRGLSSREPWKESDNYRLLSYRNKDRMSWHEVFKRFPDRSAGAVRTHYHELLKQKKV